MLQVKYNNTTNTYYPLEITGYFWLSYKVFPQYLEMFRATITYFALIVIITYHLFNQQLNCCRDYLFSYFLHWRSTVTVTCFCLTLHSLLHMWYKSHWFIISGNIFCRYLISLISPTWFLEFCLFWQWESKYCILHLA